MRQGGTLEALGDLAPQRRGVTDAPEGLCVLLDALNAERVVHAADGHDQHVVRDLQTLHEILAISLTGVALIEGKLVS